MNNEELTHSIDLFSTLDHWDAFNELAKHQDRLRQLMFFRATCQIRRHFEENPSEGWSCLKGEDKYEDTSWQLIDGDDQGLRIGFLRHYEFTLFLPQQGGDRYERINEALRSETQYYRPLFDGMSRIDAKYFEVRKLVEIRNFRFDPKFEGHFPEWPLAWYAANETEEFVKQAVEKVVRYTKNGRRMELIRELNSL